jgi:pyridinium-3,5-biscarboxylic acid mononucleotide sulfurtransferase
VTNSEELVDLLRSFRRVAVALSGGVDSAVVAQAAQVALGSAAVAITADSPSVSRRDLADARSIAKQIGIRHVIVDTVEFADPDYVRNDGSRCYHCKSELYDRIVALRGELNFEVICSGANRDDLGDYRPGLVAAAEHDVRHPLQELGYGKVVVRALARHWNLPIAEKPASPCLSSRIAPGVAVTTERTARVEAAENLLRELGLAECRVRFHEGDLARIEVPASSIEQLARSEVRESLCAEFRALGFKFVTLDLDGFRSGSLNELIDLNTRRSFAGGESP